MAKFLRPRRVLATLFVLVVLLVVLVALAPTLLNAGLGRGLIEDTIAKGVNGDVEIDDLGLGWFPPQTVGGLTVTDATGREAARLDVSANAGLLSLVLGNADSVMVELTGHLAGTVREDGSTTFQDLLAKKDDDVGPEKGGKKGDGADGGSSLPRLGLKVRDLVVDLELPESRRLKLEKVDGYGEYAPGGKFDLTLETPTSIEGMRGAVAFKVQGANLLGADGAFSSEGAVIDVRLTAERLPVLNMPGEHSVESLEVTIETKNLGLQLRTVVEAVLDLGGELKSVVAADIAVLKPFDAKGDLAIHPGSFRGGLSGTDVPAAVLQPFLAKTPVVVERDLGPRVSVEATLAGAPESFAGPAQVAVRIRSEHASLEADAIVQEDGVLDASRVEGRATVHPELFSALTDDAATLAAPVPADLVLTTLRYDADGVLSLVGTITLDAAAEVAHGALAEPIVLNALAADISATVGEASEYGVDVVAEVRRAGANAVVANVDSKLTARTAGDDPIAPGGTLTLRGLDIAGVEALLGLDPTTIAKWSGSSGDLTVGIDRWASEQTLDVTSDLPRVRGSFAVELLEDLVALRTEGDDRLDVTLPREAIVAEGAAKGDAADVPTLRDDVDLVVAVTSVRVPLAALGDEPFEPGRFEIDATVDAASLALATGQTVVAKIGDLRVRLGPGNLDAGVAIGLDAKADLADGTEAGEIKATGALAGFVDEAGKLDPAGVQLTLDSTVTQMPTAIGDMLLGLDGMLVAAVGDRMDATLESKSFSRSSGWLGGKLTTPNGTLEGRVRGLETSLRTTTSHPIKASLELTPEFRDRLLEPIHPLFADVRTTEQPIRIAIAPGGLIPLDGDAARLRADLEITIGNVEFDSGSAVLGLLKAFAKDPKPQIAGSIAPIEVKIRKGILTYERFDVMIDKYTLAWNGRVDLVNKTLDLRTELPLAALSTTFSELEGYTDKIVVPLVTRGTFDTNQTTIDPDFDIGAAATEAGFGGVINDVLKKNDLPEGLGGAIDDLLKGLGGKKKDKDDDGG